MGRKWNSFSSFIGLRSKTYHTPTMLAQSSFFGCYYSFSWLEVTVGGHQTTWPGRNQPEFLPQFGFSHALWAPCWLVLHGGMASGCQRPSLGQEAAGPGGLSYRGDLTLPCPCPWPSQHQVPSVCLLRHAALRHMGFQEMLRSLSSFRQQELPEALSTPKQHLILGRIKPH